MKMQGGTDKEREREREREREGESEDGEEKKPNQPPTSLFFQKKKKKKKNNEKQVPPSTATPKPTPAPTPAPTPSPTPSNTSTFSCSATVSTSSWQSGLLYYSSLNVALSSAKVQPLPYAVSLRIASAVTVDSAWNWSPAKVPTAGWVTGKVSEAWQAMGVGKPASLGLIVAGSAADLRPTAVSVSGSFCSVAYA